MNRDQLQAAVAGQRDRHFADWLTLTLGLAAETNPEIVQVALGKVFDLKGVEDATRRLMIVLSHVQQAAQDAKELLFEVHRQIDEIEKRVDELNLKVDQ